MHQLKVLRCDVCQAPFLFENNLEDHKKVHAPPKEEESSPEPVMPVRSNSIDTNKEPRKSARSKRKQKNI